MREKAFISTKISGPKSWNPTFFSGHTGRKFIRRLLIPACLLSLLFPASGCRLAYVFHAAKGQF